MGKTTRMEYALYDRGGCIENTCGSKAAARGHALSLKKKTGKTYEIYRYDRSGSSNYYELIEIL